MPELTVTVALLIAAASVPTVAALVAWGLAGGDGEPSAAAGVLAALVGFGAVYNAVTCFTAYWDLPAWRWWLMWVPAAAGLIGLALVARDQDDAPRDRAVGIAMPAMLAVPATLLWLGGIPGSTLRAR